MTTPTAVAGRPRATALPNEVSHAVQIELNRALYVDEKTSEIKPGDFAQLQTVLDQLVGKLGKLMTGSAQFAMG